MCRVRGNSAEKKKKEGNNAVRGESRIHRERQKKRKQKDAERRNNNKERETEI